ncbi:radical SAM family heme chaperone HemW [Fluoribacter dumoffii]|uniref:radical SAM family heme chaperone HemW n=1 Tax=Fluoribacter dumoffii TaxID=463 RepID=UPI002243CC87|nr:radical SAM family heme chaperone HemW [Fluoribacter dumoffii]MCW8417633.1 radical SAM family heme chaperone HemW [Fluoribacter dumoffii]MCW8454525.1 radical SAM family heme chaperone HemW [Fluoribacter dumoffii]MCW8461401.1 radical SAM family heme chaperone HemW [Fluoribacter dumoffii]MCW8484840.1 radical SAM family heme chaperone HemW [Fluoribacter dumoffii]
MIPLSLYIHIPWCIRKCPYCDFNSHKSPDSLPELNYVQALIADLETDLPYVDAREISSIFIGGGTPSLFSAHAYDRLFTELKTLLPFSQDIEITMEANPGTVEQQRFTQYREIGINRLSLGIQSFNPEHLRALGRIHDEQQAHRAIESARNAGFINLNLDIMHGLPKQSVAQGISDLQAAISHQPEHLSWYQLTIEPNTVFYKEKPPLPSEDEAWLLEEEGLALLKKSGFERYEISAFAKPGRHARHNLNYWLFGDYLGIGAGAHGKITVENRILRTRKHRQPREYLDKNKPFLASIETVEAQDLLFEFMLNTTRLQQPISLDLFTQRTGLPFSYLLPKLKIAEHKKLIALTKTHWQVTSLGRRYTNDLQALYL